MSAKLVVVLVFLCFVATFLISDRTVSEVTSGFLRFGQVPLQSDTIVDGRHFIWTETRGGISYTVDTMKSLRTDCADSPMALIMGMDAFLSLPGWREWRRLIDYAHIVVAHRPGWHAPRDGVLGELLAERASASSSVLHTEPAGHVYVAEVTQLEISSTALRTSISEGVDPKYLVPPAVRSIILELECYAGTAAIEQQ